MEESLLITAGATDIAESELESVVSTTGALELPEWAEGNPEGMLFPASYDIIPGRTATEILQAMVNRFGIAADEVKLERNAKRVGYSAYEVLIVASLVQAEAAPEDFRRVARVAYNRLEQGMRLQFDSTVNYALSTKTLIITEDMLAVDSPYNTFAVEGLPPTPINSPGQEAIEAALNPAKGDWIYFVTVDPETLTTKFTADYDQFLVWKKQFQENYSESATTP